MIINGNLYLTDSSIEYLEEIEEVNGNLILANCKNLKSLGKLKKVSKTLYLQASPFLNDLGNLSEIGGQLRLFSLDNFKCLHKTIKCNGDVFIRHLNFLETLENFEIKENLYFWDNKILTSFKNLKVSGIIEIERTPITKEYIEENHLNLLKQCKWK